MAVYHLAASVIANAIDILSEYLLVSRHIEARYAA